MTLTSRSFSKGSSKHENPVWITGADALMDSLKIHGVRVIFGYPGGAILPIYDAVHKAEQEGWLKHYMVRHEQGGSHAADGYARSTGEVGVCFGTSGPRGNKFGNWNCHCANGFSPSSCSYRSSPKTCHRDRRFSRN